MILHLVSSLLALAAGACIYLILLNRYLPLIEDGGSKKLILRGRLVASGLGAILFGWWAAGSPSILLLNSTGYIAIGRCQALLDDVLAVVDSHVSIICPKPDLDPVYLSLFLNSRLGQMQTERGWTGSSGQIELRREVIQDYVIWKPDLALQLRIRQMVEDTYVACLEAHRLLEDAKRRVEEMVLGENRATPLQLGPCTGRTACGADFRIQRSGPYRDGNDSQPCIQSI